MSGYCRIHHITTRRHLAALQTSNAYAIRELKLKANTPINMRGVNNNNATDGVSRGDGTAPSHQILQLLLGPGDSFGDFVSLKDAERRSTSSAVQAMSLVHVLRIDKEEFWNCIKTLEARFIDKQQWLTSMPGFKDLNRSVVNSICKTGQVKRYGPRSSIIRAGDPESNLYFCKQKWRAEEGE